MTKEDFSKLAEKISLEIINKNSDKVKELVLHKFESITKEDGSIAIENLIPVVLNLTLDMAVNLSVIATVSTLQDMGVVPRFTD